MDALGDRNHHLQSQAIHLQHQREVERQQQQILSLFRRQSQPPQPTSPSRPMGSQPHFSTGMYAYPQHAMPEQTSDRQQLPQLYPQWPGPAPDEAYLRHLLAVTSSQPQLQSQHVATLSGQPSLQPQSSYHFQGGFDALGHTVPEIPHHSATHSSAGSFSAGSPHSLHDFVLGIHAFPTPPESDNSLEHNDAGQTLDAKRSDLPLFSFGGETGSDGTIDPTSMSFDPRVVFGESYSDQQRSAPSSTPGLSPSAHSNVGLSSATSHGGSPPYSSSAPDTTFVTPEQLSSVPFSPSKPSSEQYALNPAINNAMGMLGVAGSVPSLFESTAPHKTDLKRQASGERPSEGRPSKNVRTAPPASKENSKTSRRVKREHQPIAPAVHPASESHVDGSLASKSSRLHRDSGSGSDDDSQDLSNGSSEKSQRKVAHNAIERRYRNNINDRIAALRHAVPALHDPKPLPGGRRGKKARLQNDLVDGVPRATKLNKATILGTATAYIRVLKGREIRLSNEVIGLRQLITSLEGGDELLELWVAEMQSATGSTGDTSHDEPEIDEFEVGEDSDDDDEEDSGEDEDDEKPDGQQIKRSRASRAGPLARAMTGGMLTLAIFGPDSQPNEVASTSASVPHFVKRQVLDESQVEYQPGAPAILDTFRIVTFIGIFLILVWPIISRLLTRWHRRAARSRSTASSEPVANLDDPSFDARRRALLQVLARSHPDARETNTALRTFVVAPVHPLCSAYGLVLEGAKALRTAMGLRPSATDMTSGEAAIWLRLLEVETSLGPLAEPSLVARLYTIMRVSAALELNQIKRAQGHATLALALLRALPGNAITERWAVQCWERARRCRLIAADEEASQSALDGNTLPEAHDSVDERWIDNVLRLEAWEALTYAPTPTAVLATFRATAPATARATALSPLLSVSVHLHAAEADDVWSTIFEALVRHTCPGAVNVDLETTAATTVREFIRHARTMRLELDIATNNLEREAITSRIAQLVATAPPVPESRDIAFTLLGAWSLMIGNTLLARNVCASLLRSGAVRRSASSSSLVQLVLPAGLHEASSLDAHSVDAMLDCAENVAATTLGWLLFLRGFSAMCAGTSGHPTEGARTSLITSANQLRAQLAVVAISRQTRRQQSAEGSTRRASAASLASDSGTITPTSRSQTPTIKLPEQRHVSLFEARDALTDVLATLTRRIVWKDLRGWVEEDGEDSGVEWV
ncbi:Predicted DNA-binding protein [Ceraceosorus bombacis]|uniref:Predicted DNA-binding protein n=1 Tax=Ceraceosorus bombacis TaxID=401625 RepID=A0A0P1BQZ2_9BASI|nr:Predicted DNA-binding protein [Ceraceosorus bombacis]